MFDFNLQMRFWRSATEAMLESAAATMAAASEFQSHLLKQSHPAKAPEPNPAFDAFDPVSWWELALRCAAPAQQLATTQSAAINPFNPMTWSAPWTAATPSLPMTPPCAEQWMKAYTDLWVRQPMAWASGNPFALWQSPMTMMMMSAGLPYSVASPAARASTASMDAADAAQQQMNKVYAAYRTEGGHTAAQLVVLPWTLAASFLASEAATTSTPARGLLH